MARLFLDANVLFTAAHNPRGKAAFLFEAAALGHWTLLSSAYAVEEARRNIAAKYPARSEQLEKLAAQLELAPHFAPAKASPISLPEKDLPVFLAAVAGHATHLLTGDLKHFGPHMNRPIQPNRLLIQTVAEFLASL